MRVTGLGPRWDSLRISEPERCCNDPLAAKASSDTRPRIVGSWLSQVECWFSILGGQSLSGTSFTGIAQLRNHIDAFIESYNKDAQPFCWTKSMVHQRRVKGRRISEL